MFKKTKFISDFESEHDSFGEIDFDSTKNKSVLEKLMNKLGIQSDVIWIESPDKVLEFENIKSEYLKTDSTDPKKIEYKRLTFHLSAKRVR